MRSLDVANYFIANYGGQMRITNLGLNKLVYFAQAEALKRQGTALFLDRIEAWEYGPVEPLVYHSFKRYGRGVIPVATEPISSCTLQDMEIMDSVMESYGKLTAYDLVKLSHKDGGAWKARYTPNEDVEIRIEDILASADVLGEVDFGETLSANIDNVRREWSNTIRLLEDA